MPQPILHYVLQYSLLAFGLIASLCLFVSLKRELYHQERKHREEIDKLLTRLETPAPSGPPAEASVSGPHSGFNVSRRAQAMRLLRRGEGVAHIAAALCVPDAEVELFIRVQQLAAQPFVPASPISNHTTLTQ